MTKFTKEQLIEQAQKNVALLRDAVEKTPGISEIAAIHIHLAEIALAALTAEPFSWADDAGIELLEMRYPAEVTAKKDDDFVFPLYRLPLLEGLK